MLVSNLQQFIRLLVPPLTAAGLNATAEKSVTGSLESLAAALEPFHGLSTDQLTELLKVAQEYRQTGVIPNWVIDKKPAASKSQTPKVPKAPKLSPADAVATLRAIQGRATQLHPDQIAQEVQALSGMTVNDLKAVQKDFLGAIVGKAKPEILAAIQKKIDDYRKSRDRVDGILNY